MEAKMCGFEHLKTDAGETLLCLVQINVHQSLQSKNFCTENR